MLGTLSGIFTFSGDQLNLFLISSILLVKIPDLLVQIVRMKLVDMCLAPAIRVAVIAVQCDLLSSGLLLLRDSVSRTVVLVLLAHSLQVVGNVDGREIGRGIASFGLGLLFLPTRIEELNCNKTLAMKLKKEKARW